MPATMVKVTMSDVVEGKAGDCHNCALALAVSRATGDSEAMVYEHNWYLTLQVHGRNLRLDYEVRNFVRDFDNLPRSKDGTVNLSAKQKREMKLPEFEFPDISDSEWKERCYGCEEHFQPEDLDDEGFCEECHDENSEE